MRAAAPVITSARHPLVGAIQALSHTGARGTGCCVVEGPHLVGEAVHAGLALAAVLFTPAFAERPDGPACLDGAAAAPLAAEPAGLPLVERFTCVGSRAFAAMSELKSPQGVLAVVSLAGRLPAAAGETDEGSVALALDGVQDPGNVGALTRALCAFAGAGAPLWLGAGTADPFGGKALRASAGAAFHLAVRFVPDLPAALARSVDQGRRWWGLEAHAGAPLHEQDFAAPCGLVVGSEGRGLSEAVRRLCQPLTIPTIGPVESLAAPQAGSVALYAVGRALCGEPVRTRVVAEVDQASPPGACGWGPPG